MNIKYDQKFLEIIKQCSHIANMVVIQKRANKNFIAHKNNFMAFIIETDNDMFDVSENIGFHDFKEFYNIVTTIGKEPKIELNKNILNIFGDNNMKLRYVLGNEGIISKLDNVPNLSKIDAKITIDQDILEKIKSLSKLLGLNNEINKPRIDVISKDNEIELLFRDASEEGSNNFKYSFKNESTDKNNFEISININVLLDIPTASYDFFISNNDIKLVNLKMKNTENFTINFYAGMMK